MSFVVPFPSDPDLLRRQERLPLSVGHSTEVSNGRTSPRVPDTDSGDESRKVLVQPFRRLTKPRHVPQDSSVGDPIVGIEGRDVGRGPSSRAPPATFSSDASQPPTPCPPRRPLTRLTQRVPPVRSRSPGSSTPVPSETPYRSLQDLDPRFEGGRNDQRVSDKELDTRPSLVTRKR